MTTSELLLGLSLLALILVILVLLFKGNGARSAEAIGQSWKALVDEQRKEIVRLQELLLWREVEMRREGVEPRTRAAVETLLELTHDIEQQFDKDELDQLALDMKIKPDSLDGDTIEERAMSLVLLADRWGYLQRLAREVNARRS